jgi:hypothetical protein
MQNANGEHDRASNQETPQALSETGKNMSQPPAESE